MKRQWSVKIAPSPCPPITLMDTTNTGSILRQTVIQVFAQAGETLYLGSSAVGIGSGAIEYTRPDGTMGTCGGEGRINNRAEEVVGPAPLSD